MSSVHPKLWIHVLCVKDRGRYPLSLSTFCRPRPALQNKRLWAFGHRGIDCRRPGSGFPFFADSRNINMVNTSLVPIPCQLLPSPFLYDEIIASSRISPLERAMDYREVLLVLLRTQCVSLSTKEAFDILIVICGICCRVRWRVVTIEWLL